GSGIGDVHAKGGAYFHVVRRVPRTPASVAVSTVCRPCYGGDVAGLLGVLFIVFLIVIVSKAVKGASRVGNYNQLAAKGIAARGILLQVASRPSPNQNSGFGQKFEARMVTIDVEVPGQQPY